MDMGTFLAHGISDQGMTGEMSTILRPDAALRLFLFYKIGRDEVIRY